MRARELFQQANIQDRTLAELSMALTDSVARRDGDDTAKRLVNIIARRKDEPAQKLAAISGALALGNQQAIHLAIMPYRDQMTERNTCLASESPAQAMEIFEILRPQVETGRSKAAMHSAAEFMKTVCVHGGEEWADLGQKIREALSKTSDGQAYALTDYQRKQTLNPVVKDALVM